MRKLNCWEIMNCGREPGGHLAEDLGVCPAATADECTGINDGKNAGRICWAVAGSFSKGRKHGCRAMSIASCMICDVYERIKREQNSENFHLVATKRSYSVSRR